jgi:hypothetical protein
MKSGCKSIQIFLVFALIISIPACLAFVRYYSLSEADFLSRQFKLEARDQIDLQTGYHEKSKAFAPGGFSHLLFLDNTPSKQLPAISFQISSLDLPTFVLRC